MTAPKRLLVWLLPPLLAACATTQPKYDWGGYEDALHGYYKDATKQPQLAAELATTIAASESSGKPVAPGLYAEYGYLLMQSGRKQEAAALFRKEKGRWPESSTLMDVMLRTVEPAAPVAEARKE
jgi:hypothetical protein